MKNLCIFEKNKTKTFTELLDYNNNQPTRQGFFFEENNEKLEKLSNTYVKDQKIIIIKEKSPTSKIENTCIERPKIISIKKKQSTSRVNACIS